MLERIWNRNFGIAAVAILLIGAIGGGMIRRSIGRTSSPAGTSSSAAKVEQDFETSLSIISDNYAGDVDYERATQAAIQGMLWTLDPHSTYFSRLEFQKLREDQDSRFYGIGVSIVQHRDGVYVQSLVQDTPAARAGLQYGDRIVEVDGKDARDWTSAEVSKNVRGERGVAVKVKVERAGLTAPVEYEIVRDAVPLPSIRNFFIVRPGVGYIGLTGGFQHTSDAELGEAIAKLEAQGMRQMVLDLRGNPGGLLDQAIKVASRFIERGKVITSVRGRTDYAKPDVYRSAGNDTEDFPLVVLINHNTASASEIVAGAIQDHGRGLIVGQTSFGKGLVQRVIELQPFGTGLTLTTARYYTPYGRSLQRDYSNGSLYDYYVRHDEEDEAAANKSKSPAQPGASPAATPVATPTPPTATGTPVQTAGGRVFYGGGGITPDVEVKPLELTTLRSRISEAAFYFTRTLAAGQVAGLEDYKVEKMQFGHVPRPTDYPITDRVVEAFREFLQKDPKQGLLPAQIEPELEFVKLRLRDEIMTAAYSGDAGSRVLLESDLQLLRAIELLPDARRLAESIRTAPTIG